MMNDWRREIITLCLVKERLAEVSVGRQPSWTLHYPENPATNEQLRAAEQVLGFDLDPMYRAFLAHANGWRGFFQRIDLFGTFDLVGGTRHSLATTLLTVIEDIGEITGLQQSDLLPIAVSQFDIDVFVLAKPCTKSSGKVLWLAGGLIDTFPNFDEYFLAMVDYNRREIQRFD